ncbi:hypothetical protein FRUB_09665 [Fimbriiglobus ruber]|uniref:Uncharacterized protein n=1 Tax=Fimbriiglobus ruber TaxID=1908690 RepID=A0A225D1M8_9BACT|nr:hypothetical protein FRUB_09665 [Fimbriiglobus ruber]
MGLGVKVGRDGPRPQVYGRKRRRNGSVCGEPPATSAGLIRLTIRSGRRAAARFGRPYFSLRLDFGGGRGVSYVERKSCDRGATGKRPTGSD